MVMRAYSKTLFRMLKENIARLLAVTAIITIGISFITGLGAVPPTLKASVNSYYTEHSVPDIIIKSVSEYGFSETQKNILTGQEFIEGSVAFTSYDLEIEALTVRIYYLPLQNLLVNKIDLLAGRFPENDQEILVERASEKIIEKEIGSTLVLNGQNLTIVGITANPLLFSKMGEPSIFEGKELDLVLYFDSEISSPPFPVITDIYIKITGAEKYSVFSNEYKNLIREKTDCLKQIAADEGSFVFLSMKENKSAALIDSYADKIQVISYFFPIFFLAVSVLVVLATMARFAEEERTVIGCYKTLGYGKEKIIFKYLFFTLVCCVTGCMLGLIIGNFMVMPVILQSFQVLFHVTVSTGFYISFGALSAGIMIAAIVSVTLGVMVKLLKEKPAGLLKPKSPKAGKKIFLEKIPFIWKRLKFKYKSSLRNIFRYPGHFIMTIVSVAGSGALVLAGLALLNAAGAYSADAEGMMKSLGLISVVIIIFAALLDILVIYNLTNMNISERKREIATLKVLGYKFGEVAGYIFREIFILSLIGIIIGLPLGYIFIHVVFSFVGFGSVSDIKWYSWIITFFLSIIFTLTVDALLYKKIARADMLEALKINE